MLFLCTPDTNAYVLCRFFGGGFGGEEEEDKTPKGDDVVVEISASLEDLYVGNTMKVNLSFCLNIVTSLIIFCHYLDSQRLYLDRFGERRTY